MTEHHEQLSIDDTFFLNDPRGFLLSRGYSAMPVATGHQTPIASHYLEPTAYVIEWWAPVDTLRLARARPNTTLVRDGV